MSKHLLVLALTAVACATPDPTTLDDSSEAAAQPSPTPVFARPTSDTATSVAVKNGMTLTMHASLAWKTSTALELVLQGETSQDLDAVYGFIPDDGFGTSTELGPKSFELVFDNASDIDTVVSGEPFYLELTTHTTAGSASWAAQIIVTPRLVVASGTTRVALGAAITPTPVSTNPNGIVFRGTLTTTEKPQTLAVTGSSTPTLVEDGAHAWHFDWDFSSFESAATGAKLTATGKFGATTSTRTGTIAIRVASVALAAGGGSPDDIYGLPSCDTGIQACLIALPEGTTDFSSCGDWYAVSLCN